jgi:HEAT repeat protein
MIVIGLGKLQDDRVVDVLLSLLDDDELVCQALMALGKLRARAAQTRIEALLSHSRPQVRKEAKKALARTNKAR